MYDGMCPKFCQAVVRFMLNVIWKAKHLNTALYKLCYKTLRNLSIFYFKDHNDMF